MTTIFSPGVGSGSSPNYGSKDVEDLLTKKFAAAKKNLATTRKRGMQELDKGLARQQAISGLSGGAANRAQSQSRKEYEESFIPAQVELEGQEAGALAAAKESGLARQQQESQFARTLGFQKESFDRQMEFQEKEFLENLKTNTINAAIAMRDAGLDNPHSLANVLRTMGQAGSFTTSGKTIRPWADSRQAIVNEEQRLGRRLSETERRAIIDQLQ